MPLNRRDIIQLASTIDERRAALLEEIRREVARGRDESYAELAGATHDRAEEALADLVADLGNAEVTRDLAEVRELEAARRRIADGVYGVCLDCGDDIPLERLRAQPGAARCTRCQAQHEKTYRA
jgi:RNA polymerase-binding transcription factor DksA